MEKEGTVKTSGNNSSGIVAVVLGILSIVFALTVILGSFAGAAFGLIGFFFALTQRKNNPNRWSKWGLILTVIGLILNIIVIFALITVISSIAQQIQELQASGAFDQATFEQFQQYQNAAQ